MVTGQLQDKLSAALKLGRHELITSVSEKLGGDDSGPNPHELLEAALAGCTLLTVKMYANRKAMKLEKMSVDIRILSEGATTTIARDITLRGELTSEERERLLEIANKCPIHKLLSGQILIETKLI